MKFLISIILFIVLYELIKNLHENFYKNWKNKYFCRDVCNDIMLKHPFKERVFYDGFYVDVGHNDNYIVVLETQSIAAWFYKSGEVRDLCIYNEELFKTFKEKYILENN